MLVYEAYTKDETNEEFQTVWYQILCFNTCVYISILPFNVLIAKPVLSKLQKQWGRAGHKVNIMVVHCRRHCLVSCFHSVTYYYVLCLCEFASDLETEPTVLFLVLRYLSPCPLSLLLTLTAMYTQRRWALSRSNVGVYLSSLFSWLYTSSVVGPCPVRLLACICPPYFHGSVHLALSGPVP